MSCLASGLRSVRLDTHTVWLWISVVWLFVLCGAAVLMLASGGAFGGALGLLPALAYAAPAPLLDIGSLILNVAPP